MTRQTLKMKLVRVIFFFLRKNTLSSSRNSRAGWKIYANCELFTAGDYDYLIFATYLWWYNEDCPCERNQVFPLNEEYEAGFEVILRRGRHGLIDEMHYSLTTPSIIRILETQQQLDDSVSYNGSVIIGRVFVLPLPDVGDSVSESCR